METTPEFKLVLTPKTLLLAKDDLGKVSNSLVEKNFGAILSKLKLLLSERGKKLYIKINIDRKIIASLMIFCILYNEEKLFSDLKTVNTILGNTAIAIPANTYLDNWRWNARIQIMAGPQDEGVNIDSEREKLWKIK